MDDVTQRNTASAATEIAALVRARPGLSGKLLILTIAFVMLAEVLIYSLGRELQAHLADEQDFRGRDRGARVRRSPVRHGAA